MFVEGCSKTFQHIRVVCGHIVLLIDEQIEEQLRTLCPQTAHLGGGHRGRIELISTEADGRIIPTYKLETTVRHQAPGTQA